MTDELTHPLRLSSGRMPHELDPAMFNTWLRRQAMSEHDYWMSVGADQDLSEEYGAAKLTIELTEDQRGWAKQRFGEHYRTNGARWYVRPDKPTVPIPAVKMTKKPKRRRRHG